MSRKYRDWSKTYPEGNEAIARFLGWEYKNGKYQTESSNSSGEYYFLEVEGCVWWDEHGFAKYEGLDFDVNWNSLMAVVEKIGSTRYRSYPINVTISSTGAHIAINGSNGATEKYEGQKVISNTLNLNYDEEYTEYTPFRKAVWVAVVHFIEWYNEKTKEQG